MKNKKDINLLGCGWLGFPLALDLISRGFTVKGSTTSPEKMPVLKNAGIDPILVQFDQSLPDPDLTELLDADILIVSVPPGRRSSEGPENYKRMGEILSAQIPGSRISKLIFISSTSVYSESNRVLTESSEISPVTVSGKVIAGVEKSMLSLPIQVIIIRLAGLFGPGRSPGRFFAGKTNIPNGLAPVNMIHQEDVIALIWALIDSDTAEGVYIGSTPSHPTKEEFYTLAARLDKLPEPDFIPEMLNWKIVESERVEKELGFSYKFPNLMDRLNQA
ncbi:MAG: SDR family oxidoreductase [Daejeonella sp.]|uniref:SDR family oxidoreductase n=1 Tax=Daejeonella sp. TaxID=2805397 RepID=UPI002735F484|nr:SDR family oxidoreductase [Daejeonella sp.]MDP3468052.1 SDR family oxidoreductase [Daejeonella sp.]